MSHKLDWQTIAPAAAFLFKIWVDQPELKWAEKAWAMLAKRGLTTYTNELEKQVVLLRLYTLAKMYGDFCQRAFDETCYIKESVWGWQECLEENELYLSFFRLGQLVGPTEFLDKECYAVEDEKDWLPDLVNSIAEAQTATVFAALLAEFGSVTELLLSLWNSNRSPEDVISDVDQIPFESWHAYSFVEDGMRD
jgi:hypothetical protein